MKTKLYLTVLLLLQAFVGLAQPGDIDNSFNLSGIGAYGGNAVLPTVDGTKDGIVYKTDVYPASSVHKDKIIIIGRFSSYNGVQRKKIARINADGSLDTGFSTPYFSTDPATDYLYCVKILPNNKILVGGSFSIGPSNVFRGIARFNDDGTLDTTFNPVASGVRGTNGPVHAITLQSDGKILIGGDFTTFNGSGSRRLIRLNSDGSLDSTFDTTGTPNGEVRAIAIQKLGANANKILVGGFFTGWTGQPNKGRLIRVLPNGDFDTTFNAGGTGITGGSAVFDIIVKPDSDSFFAVGKFSSFNGTPRNSIVFLAKNAELLMNTIGTGANETIFSAKFQPDGKVLLGGNFKVFGGVTIPKGITRISIKVPASPAIPYIERDVTFLTGTGFTGGTGVYEGISVIRDLVLQSDGKIIVSGDYTEYDGNPRRMISRIKTRECPYASVYSEGVWKDGIVIDNTTIDNYMAITKGEFIIPTGSHFKACELEIQAEGTLTIQPGASLTVNGIVMNNGHFTIENSGALVQTKEDTKNADLGAGIFTMKRSTSPLKLYDYVYWSTPVENLMLHDLSPLTRFDKFYKYSPAIDNWVEITNGTEIMVEGKGYIARAPSNQIVNQPQHVSFVGRPHNGKITLPIQNSVGNFNLVGNPYPSAINANTFLHDADNSSIIGGTIYLWSHATAISSGTTGDYQYNYSESDYISYNKLGGTLTNPTGVLFAGKVAAGQSFFIEALSNTNVTFKNTMRLTGDNSQFYKNSGQQTVSEAPSRLWIDFYNAQGAYKQALVGFAEGATMEMDRDYDGISLPGTVDFYSLVGDNKLVIQGRPLPFDNNQMVPMGYMTPAAGTFKIALNQFDGLFSEQTVFLVDHLTNTIHNLKSGSYTFNTMAGTHNNRFELKFTTETLNAVDHQIDSKKVIVASKNNTVTITAEESIDSVNIYDLTGKLLFSKKGIDAKSFTTDHLNIQQQVVMVMIKFTNNQTVTKKVVL